MKRNPVKKLWQIPLFALVVLSVSTCSLPLLTLATEDRSEHNIGINLFASQLDWCEDRLFADVMKMSREWTTPGNFGSGALVATDGDGWPTEDAEVVVWHGLDRMDGTYHLEGECNSEPSIAPGYGIAEVQGFKYSGGRFTANLVYRSTDRTGLLLTFRNTGGGVRNVKLMRPRTPGSSIPYAATTTFTSQAKDLVANFKVIRFMWAVDAWNGAWQVAWSDRVQPDHCSYQRGAGSANIGWAGKGMPWEMAIRFCNETGKDMWLNMPLGANDDYIRQLATLVRDTYTVPDGKVYWEYSNEATWDMLGVTKAYLQTTGLAEAQSGGPVGYDGITANPEVAAARYYAKRAAEMSAIWRSVWGDADMMSRVRPVASGQLTYDGELIWGLEFVSNWFNNGDGQHVADPHPVNYYFYGCGGSHYTGDDPDAAASLRYSDAAPGVSEIEQFEAYEEEEACLAKIFGLKRCAYEGGVWTSAGEYLFPRITDAMIRYHRLWNKYDCDLLMYYVSTGGEEDGKALGFTMSSFDLDTPKFEALDSILATPKGEAAAGEMAPCTIEAADYSVASLPWLHPAASGGKTFGAMEFSEWNTFKGYLFRVQEKRRYSIRLLFRDTTDSQIEIMVDGAVIAKDTLSGSEAAYSLNLSPGLHGLRVKKCNPGSFFLNKIWIQ